MKKSLSTILSLAMAFSMFSSVAMAADAAKTSADFSDLKDLDAATKAKFDALISAGIFDGVKEGTFGLKEDMNRAQFAKVAALIFGLKVDTTLKTSSFTDVKADDPANGYALAYIEAAKAAGITDGYAPGEYNPAGKVTKEQLAAFLIRGLRKDSAAKATPGVNDTTVSDWAKGYVAYALNQKLLTNGSDGKFGGTSNATRDLLVLGSYEAKQQFKPEFNGKYAIASLKATDANVLVLALNGALTPEAEKALTIAVKKNDSAVPSGYTVKWDDKKTVATLTFDAKFQDEKYSVTIGGVSNIDDTAKTASVTTTVEKITKVDFTTASETLPLAWDVNPPSDHPNPLLHKVRIDFKATNQYGAQSKLTSSSFTIKVSGDSTTSPVAGAQAFYLLQSDVDTNDRISISILHEESGVQATRVFTVGMESQVSKIELGDLLDPSGNKLEAIDGNGGYGYIGFTAYDQYGFRVDDAYTLNDSVNVYTNDSDLDTGMDNNNDNPFIESVVGDDAAELKIRSTSDDAREATVSVTATGSGQSVSKTIKIGAVKEPAALEIGTYSYTLAEGDVRADMLEDEFQKIMYVPLIVKDTKGVALTPDEIVNAYYYYENTRFKPKFEINSSNGINLPGDEFIIEKTGPYKGFIKIDSIDKTGPQDITVTLGSNQSKSATWRTSVAAQRTIESVKFSTTPKKYMTKNAKNDFRVKFYDQYGQPIKYVDNKDYTYDAQLTFRNTGNGDHASDVTLYNRTNGLPVTQGVYTNNPPIAIANLYDIKYEFETGDAQFTANDPNAPFELKVELFRKDRSSGDRVSINSVTTTMELLNDKDTGNNFTYETYLDKAINNNTILAAGEYFDAPGSTVQQATYIINDKQWTKLGKEVKVRVKYNGEEVKTAAKVESVSSTNQNVAYGVNTGSKFIVAGIDQGTTDLALVYSELDGDRSTAKLPVTTKNESPQVQSIVLKRSEQSAVPKSLFITGTSIFSRTVTTLAQTVTIKDQYGDEFKSEVLNPATANGDENITAHIEPLNLTFYIDDVVNGSPDDFDPASLKQGIIKFKSANSTISSFTVNIMAPSGASAAFTVKSIDALK